MREFCFRCRRAKVLCYCDQIREVEAEARFVLLQHPAESRKAVGTARMAHLALPGSRLLAGVDFSAHPEVNAWLEDPSLLPMILYPGPTSLDLSAMDESGRSMFFPEGRRPLIFVIDGTWYGASRILRLSRNLASIPRIQFAFEAESEYRIRKQPREYCLSTIEAVWRILEILEPTSSPERLMKPFRWMVERQIECHLQRMAAGGGKARVAGERKAQVKEPRSGIPPFPA